MKKSHKKTREWITNGRPVRKVDAQVVGLALEQIRREHGALTPELVLEAAKKKSSPLHRYFEWDVESAARICWLEQARRIIACVTIVTVPGKVTPVRAFLVVGDSSHRYIDRDAMLASRKSRGVHVAHALDELESWVRRYSDFPELEDIRNGVEVLLRRRDQDAAAE